MSYTNISAMIEAGVGFITSASKTDVAASELVALDLDSATVVDYTAGRDAGTPTGQRGSWRVTEDTMTVAGKRNKDPVHTLRRVFVHSSARAGGAASA